MSGAGSPISIDAIIGTGTPRTRARGAAVHQLKERVAEARFVGIIEVERRVRELAQPAMEQYLADQINEVTLKQHKSEAREKATAEHDAECPHATLDLAFREFAEAIGTREVARLLLTRAEEAEAAAEARLVVTLEAVEKGAAAGAQVSTGTSASASASKAESKAEFKVNDRPQSQSLDERLNDVTMPTTTQRPRNQSTTSGGRNHAPASLGSASAAPSAARPTSAQLRPARPTSAQARQQAARAARPASAQVRSLGGDGGDDEVDEVAERAEAATALQARVRGRRSRLSAADEGGNAAADARVERAQASLLQAGGRPTATQSAAGATSFHAAQEEEENAARTLLLQEPSAAHRRPSVQDRVRPTDQRRRGSISS